MDADNSDSVEIEEICIVHDSDRESMLKILDKDGNGTVDVEGWLNYLSIKKKEKGKKKFQFFLNYLEQEVPKNIPKLEEAQAACGAKGSGSITSASACCFTSTRQPRQRTSAQ